MTSRAREEAVAHRARGEPDVRGTWHWATGEGIEASGIEASTQRGTGSPRRDGLGAERVERASATPAPRRRNPRARARSRPAPRTGALARAHRCAKTSAGARTRARRGEIFAHLAPGRENEQRRLDDFEEFQTILEPNSIGSARSRPSANRRALRSRPTRRAAVRGGKNDSPRGHEGHRGPQRAGAWLQKGARGRETNLTAKDAERAEEESLSPRSHEGVLRLGSWIGQLFTCSTAPLSRRFADPDLDRTGRGHTLAFDEQAQASPTRAAKQDSPLRLCLP